jgi:hypothetical protein
MRNCRALLLLIRSLFELLFGLLALQNMTWNNAGATVTFIATPWGVASKRQGGRRSGGGGGAGVSALIDALRCRNAQKHSIF